MALRDRVIVSTVTPRKSYTVDVTSPGGTVQFETYGDSHIKVSERTRKGKEKRAMLFARDNVALLEVVNA